MSRTRTGRLRVSLLLIPLLSGLFAVTGCRERAGGDSGANRPHVLLLTVDTLRPDYLSLQGYDRPTSPRIDALVANGVYFNKAVTPVPRTTPALASLLTGKYPHGTGVRTLVDALSPNAVTLPLLAAQAGYRTLAVVSNHILTPERRLGIGFDVYDAADDTRDAAATTAKLLDLAREYRGERLFLWAHYIDPHVPYWPTPERAREFDPDYTGRYPLYFGGRPGGVGQAAYPADYPKPVFVFRNPLDDAVNAHVRRLYAADIRMTDDAVGQLIDALEREIGGEWLIVFTSDHGESLGEHDYFYDHGDYVYNATLRVPLAIIPPSSQRAFSGRVDDWVSLVDVFPTLVEYLALGESAGSDPARDTEGRSLLPLLRGKSMPARAVYAESGRSYFPGYVRKRKTNDVAGKFRAVIHEDWKLILTPGQSAEKRFELYDIASDPHEERNLYTPAHPRGRELISLLSGWMEQDQAARTLPGELSDELSSEDRERLRSLGYMD